LETKNLKRIDFHYFKNKFTSWKILAKKKKKTQLMLKNPEMDLKPAKYPISSVIGRKVDKEEVLNLIEQGKRNIKRK
jgi:hypothetical protein